MSIIRATHAVSRRVNRFKAEYPSLYNDFQLARKQEHYGVNSWVSVSGASYREYQELSKLYEVTKFPKDNKEVMITTHDGGKYVGYYENDQWWYRSLRSIVLVTAYVIKWEKYVNHR